MRISYNDEDLVKNGVTREEVKEVFFSDLSYAEEMGPSARGNDRAMIIGWTFAGRILEVGVEYFDSEDEEHVFHAMDAGPKYSRQFLKRIRT